MKIFYNFSLAFYRKWIRLSKYRYMAASQIAAATVVKSCAHGERGSAMFLCEQKVDAASSDLPLGGGLPGRHGPDPQSGRMSDPLLGTAGDPIAPRADKRSGRRLRIDHTAGPRHLSGLLGGGGWVVSTYLYYVMCLRALGGQGLRLPADRHEWTQTPQLLPGKLLYGQKPIGPLPACRQE